jgi:hypothetical protein
MLDLSAWRTVQVHPSRAHRKAQSGARWGFINLLR